MRLMSALTRPSRTALELTRYSVTPAKTLRRSRVTMLTLKILPSMNSSYSYGRPKSAGTAAKSSSESIWYTPSAELPSTGLRMNGRPTSPVIVAK